MTQLAEAAVAPRIEPTARREAERMPPAARRRDRMLPHERLDAARAIGALLVTVPKHAKLRFGVGVVGGMGGEVRGERGVGVSRGMGQRVSEGRGGEARRGEGRAVASGTGSKAASKAVMQPRGRAAPREQRRRHTSPMPNVKISPSELSSAE